MNALPLIIFAVLIVAMFYVTKRNRSRMAQKQQEQKALLAPGAEVMTTSGLYGTVVSVNHEDDTVLLSIAPGVEVKWAMAALRDKSTLPPRYASGPGAAQAEPAAPSETDGATGEATDGDIPPAHSYWDDHPRGTDGSSTS